MPKCTTEGYCRNSEILLSMRGKGAMIELQKVQLRHTNDCESNEVLHSYDYAHDWTVHSLALYCCCDTSVGVWGLERRRSFMVGLDTRAEFKQWFEWRHWSLVGSLDVNWTNWSHDAHGDGWTNTWTTTRKFAWWSKMTNYKYEKERCFLG